MAGSKVNQCVLLNPLMADFIQYKADTIVFLHQDITIDSMLALSNELLIGVQRSVNMK